MSTVWKDVSAAAPVREYQFTAEEQQAIDDVLDAAVAWVAGELPTTEAERIGTALNRHGNPSPARTRALAYWHLLWTDRWDSDERRALEALTNSIGAKDYKHLPDGSRVPWAAWNANERGVEVFTRNGGAGTTHQGDH